MKVVTAKMHPEKREVVLEEVEFDGTVKGLCSLLKLYKYEESIESEDGLHASTASDLIVNENHSYINNGCDKGRGGPWGINNMVFGDGYEIVFVGLTNILEKKPLLTIDYLKSTIMYPSQENPDMLSEGEQLGKQDEDTNI